MSKDMFEELKQRLSPQGTADVVRLDVSGFYNSNAVALCIQKLALKAQLARPGLDSLTITEKLLLEMLCDAANLD